MELLTTAQVCEELKISVNNLHQLQFRKQLNWVKKEGKKVFYAIEDVAKLKEKRFKSQQS
jgi:hypothetical protein